MLSGILEKSECAGCRLCCTFDAYGLWLTPYISEDTAQLIREKYKPSQCFIRKDSHLLLRMEQNADGLFPCPLLDPEKGCIMEDDKPFDCKIWPLMLMEKDGKRVITLSAECPVLSEKPLEEIKLSAERLAPAIFSYADTEPKTVRKYSEGYEVLFEEK